MSHFLYQLKVIGNVSVGRIVRINGPWDTYGHVIKLRDSGYHLIRGLGHKKQSGYLLCP